MQQTLQQLAATSNTLQLVMKVKECQLIKEKAKEKAKQRIFYPKDNRGHPLVNRLKILHSDLLLL